AEPDHAAVLVRLAPEVEALRLPAGTALVAGHDPSGVERIYRTERELMVGRAEVAQLRSVHVDRRITEIPDVRSDRSLTARQAFERSLELALGDPRPGDPVPNYAGALIDHNFVVGLASLLAFSRTHLHLEHHELRALMKRVRRRAAADREWAELNRLMGVQSPAEPRAFASNLASVVGVLDFETDGLPQVASLDDLYDHRGEPDVRAYIDDRLAAIGWDDFVAMMVIKRRIDADWAQINRTLEQIGRRQRGVLSWSLDPVNPTAFTSNLAKALGDGWPPPWPWATTNIDSYDAQLRALERHFAMPVERLERLVGFAEQL